jgi:hypothetical protein
MGDIIKDFYFACEDKWYAGLDWLDKHGIPVYQAIDPIDSKIPSFALASGLILLGLIFTFFSLGGLLQGSNVNVLFQVVDEQSNPLPNVDVAFTLNGKTETRTSDALGEIEFLAPNGARINYKVDIEKYEIINKSVSAAEDQIEVIQLSELQSQNLKKTIKLVNEVGQPILREAELTFACATAYGSAPNSISGTGGTFEVTPNANCIPFVVSVSAEGYLPVQSYPITANKDVYSITLTENVVRDASIIVSVTDDSGASVSGMDISLQKNGLDIDHAYTDAAGSAVFNVAAGTYTIVASDNVNSVYTSATETISVSTGETVQVELSVNKNASNTILVTVIDKKTNAALKDATVKLKSGTTTLSTVTTKADGKASIPVADKTISYTITASRDGYIPQQQTIQGSAVNVSFGLDKATSSNAAKLNVQLVDQDSEPVADARVVLYNADTGFLAPYPFVLSDSNGMATFAAVVSGNYQAFAYKKTLTGFSSEQFFDITDPSTHLFSLKVEVPDGTVQIHVTDTRGEPVPFARVSVYNAFKNQLLGADLTDTNGTYTLPRNQQKSKADKDVFLVVSKTGYATLTTIQKPVLPDTTQNFEVVLHPTDPTGNISIELVGVYSTDGKIVTGVGKGKDFVAKFRVNVPEEHDELDMLNVHVRTGEKDIVEKDDWYIDTVAFPRSTIFKGSSWDPANGLNTDGESATNGAAKWFNAELNNPLPGEYEFEATLRVRSDAVPQDILKLSYKVFAENGDELRDPADANPADELYAATKSATYQVGVTTACDNDFCFDASILDVDEGRIEDVTEQYNGSVFTTYKLTFNLLNNGNEFHTNSNLRVKASSDAMELLNYEIFTADALELTGVVNDNEFKSPLNVGNFTPQKKVGGSILFRAKEVGTTTLTLELVSDFSSVFSKTIQVNVTGDKTLQVNVSPNIFPSNIPVTITIHAEDASSGEDQANALVTIENVSEVVLATKTTDDAGNAEIELPGQLPGKKVTLRVEKAEYNPFVQVIEASDKVLSLNPVSLGVGMNVKTDTSRTDNFTLTNETSLPLVITSMKIQGNLKGFLDVERINSALQPYVGVTLSPKGQLDAQLTSILTPEGQSISTHEDLDAVIAIETENYGNPWSFELPVRYALGATSEVDDPTCFTIAPKTWVTSTDGQSVTYEFTIRNNCAIKGTPSALQELSTRVTWNGNELGEFVLSVFEQNNPTAIAAAKVRGGYFSPLLTTIPAQDELIARLDFTPYGGVKGEGTFDVEVQATNPLEGKPQLLLDKIHGEIAVVNLSDCIIYDKEIVDLLPGKKDSFVMETRGCGAPIDVVLKSEVELSTKQFTLQGTDKKIIDVSDAQLDLGQYPIYVEVEGQENKLSTQNKVIRARIRDPNACVQLNRYEFDVYDDPGSNTDGFDTARLDNLCVNQRVKVKIVVEKSFMDSLRKGLTAGLFAFLGTGVNNTLNDVPFLGKASEQASAAAALQASQAANTEMAASAQELKQKAYLKQSTAPAELYAGLQKDLPAYEALYTKARAHVEDSQGFTEKYIQQDAQYASFNSQATTALGRAGTQLSFLKDALSSEGGSHKNNQIISAANDFIGQIELSAEMASNAFDRAQELKLKPGQFAGSSDTVPPEFSPAVSPDISPAALAAAPTEFQRVVGECLPASVESCALKPAFTMGAKLDASGVIFLVHKSILSGAPSKGVDTIQFSFKEAANAEEAQKILFNSTEGTGASIFAGRSGQGKILEIDMHAIISSSGNNYVAIVPFSNLADYSTSTSAPSTSAAVSSAPVDISKPVEIIAIEGKNILHYSQGTGKAYYSNGIFKGIETFNAAGRDAILSELKAKGYPFPIVGPSSTGGYVLFLPYGTTDVGKTTTNYSRAQLPAATEGVLNTFSNSSAAIIGETGLENEPALVDYSNDIKIETVVQSGKEVTYFRIAAGVQIGEVWFESSGFNSILFKEKGARDYAVQLLQEARLTPSAKDTAEGFILVYPADGKLDYDNIHNGYHRYIVKTSANQSSAFTIPSTGFAVLLQGKNESIGQTAANSAIGSAVGGGLGKITDILSLNTKNPFIAFGVTTIAVTAIDYFMSKDQEYSTTVLGKDVDVRALSMIAGEKGADESVPDADIRVTKSGIALNPKISLEKEIVGRLESTTLTFTNISKKVNEILFRTLLTSGKRYEYTPNTKYKNHVPDENELKAKEEKNFSSKFHLQFNTLDPETLVSTQVPPIALNCDTFSEKSGSTGMDALPRVSFAWNFNDISPDACDEGRVDSQGNDAGIYCDATQFSIATLQKVEALRTFITNNAPFNCPIEDSESGVKTQPIPSADIGIASIRFDKVGVKDVNIIVGIENKSPAVNHAQVKVSYALQGSGNTNTTLSKDVIVPIGGSRISVGFVVSNVPDGTYDATATIVPETCENCSNSTTATDTIESTFFIGSGNELVACEPFSTKRLDAFIQASKDAGKTLVYPAGYDEDSLLKLVNYRARLMQDRFSPDFFSDFDRYARKVSFFNAPTYYLNSVDGLHRVFTNNEHWIVNREGTPTNPAGYLLPGPGIYDVTLDINYTDSSMVFFKNGEPDAIVNVFVEKTNTTEDVSPFYSLPFNGLIGTDDGQGRVGYGVNYAGEKVVVNEDSAEQVSTIDIVDSTPVSRLQTSTVDAYSILNSTERGNILTLTKSGSSDLALKWSPSYATPVMMTIVGSHAQGDVFGFYSIGVNNDTSQSYIGAKGNPWYGVGANCRDFSDKGMLDAYNPRYDASAINADCALVGAQENISYGFEWCENTIHTGKVNLKTVFYTPQGSLSTIVRSAYVDDLLFVGEGISGGDVPLNGTNKLEHNTPGDQLSSIEDVLNLVRDNAVCVRNSGSKTEFFWNPKEVLNAIEKEEKAAEAACIVK